MKIIGRIAIILFASILLLAGYCYFSFRPTADPVWGVNFSSGQAQYMGFAPDELFLKILRELHPKKIRLTAYWEDLEPARGRFEFSQTDLFLSQAQAEGAKVTLVLGRKQPRWPECHVPSWYNDLDSRQKQQALLSMINTAVDHFKASPAVERWQVENEPFFNYGSQCPVMTAADLQTEIAEVKKADERPVVLTDSGEKSSWLAAARLADIFGTTMYRRVYQGNWHRYFTYPLPPAWYRLHAGLVTFITSLRQIVDVELQAEPWFQVDINSLTPDQHAALLSVSDLQNNIAYAKATGLSEHFFWGTEWWFYMQAHGHPEYVEAVRKLMSQ